MRDIGMRERGERIEGVKREDRGMRELRERIEE